MPITNTLTNARELEDAGIPKGQAKVIEQAQNESQEDLKEFFPYGA